MLTQVLPSRVHRLDQRELLGSRPALDLLFSSDCRLHLIVSFEEHQAIAFVLFCEALKSSIFVLPDSMLQIARDPGVEHTRATCDDVNGIEMFAHAGKHSSYMVEKPHSSNLVRVIAGGPSAKKQASG